MSSHLSDVLRDMAEDRRPADAAKPDGHDHGHEHGHEHGHDAGAHDPNNDAADGREIVEPDETIAPEEPAEPDPTHELAAIEQQIGDESGEPVGSSALRSSAPRGAPRARADDNRGLQAAAVPVLITVGLLLMLLGAWGTAVASGHDIVLSDRPDADRMARAMILIGYPLGAALLAGAGFFIHQIRRRGHADRAARQRPS